jgi:hypothetical protein
MRADFYSIKRSELRQLIDGARSLLEQADTFTNREGYLVLEFEDNPELKQILEDIGFFVFHPTNHGYVAGVHQIVLFLYTGIWFLRYKERPDRKYRVVKGILEVHHLDGNRKNNDPKNLWYVTPQQNSLCANAIGQMYPGKVKHAHVKSWAKFGGGATDTAKLIRLTVVRTLLAKGFSIKQIPPVVSFLLTLPSKLGEEIFKYWKFDCTRKLFNKHA